ncbi:MAG TPA: hypothetical protein VN345_03840 [Blastocatellia bacterium]|jgi:hypothetical protein|nr:hypothetical protein [Blastocatellia bacterium]
MAKELYKAAFNAAEKRLREALAQKTALEQEIEHLRETLLALANLCGKQLTDVTLMGLADAGLTEAVGMVLQFSSRPLTPVQIKTRLADAGFNLKKFRNPMAAIHTTLDRMEEQDKIIRYENAEGKPAFGHKQPIPITMAGE